jgi:hypothetical protein
VGKGLAWARLVGRVTVVALWRACGEICLRRPDPGAVR